MSFVLISPEVVSAAAGDLAKRGIDNQRHPQGGSGLATCKVWAAGRR
ncbi:PE-PGRS family protein [Mycobacterium tuberculosis variant africanum K85]|uniref:PE-PGRS family protein n=1 Tax=Mycobacterium tuberculosis variant africanum K85 TaxID=611304 RepID=A0A9P2H453_MYCTX|nr:PE-PGRS family protein [Mycobacterium tuberculosis variant africanum K85]